MIGLALSGGGSRAIAFHLGCLRALNDVGLLERIGVISTISGGSFIGAYYAYTPHKSFTDFDSDICRFLREGFQEKIIIELMKPRNLIGGTLNLLATMLDTSLSRIHEKEPTVLRYPSRTDAFNDVLQKYVFPNLRMSSLRRRDINVVIGACELRKGLAFRFGNRKSGDWHHGEMVDWDVDVSFAVTASAAYPILLPAFDRRWKFLKDGKETDHRVLLTDGGVYDNLGLQVLEPGRNLSVSIHTFPCDYLIVCNAGRGQDTGLSMPLTFLPRVTRSFEIAHRRVQESTMHRLHLLKQTGQIKGFVMPYLGQQDDSLMIKPANLIPRSDVMSYPTDFAAMSEQWLEKLAGRGEQLTRNLVDYYLAEII